MTIILKFVKQTKQFSKYEIVLEVPVSFPQYVYLPLSEKRPVIVVEEKA